MQRLDHLTVVRHFLESGDEGALWDALEVASVDAVLDDVFDAMAAAFLPARAGDARGVVQWDVGTPRGVRTYQLAIGDGRCVVGRGAAAPASVTLSALLPDFLRIVSGRLNAMQAYMQRQLVASGDVLFAKRQEDWFERA